MVEIWRSTSPHMHQKKHTLTKRLLTGLVTISEFWKDYVTSSSFTSTGQQHSAIVYTLLLSSIYSIHPMDVCSIYTYIHRTQDTKKNNSTLCMNEHEFPLGERYMISHLVNKGPSIHTITHPHRKSLTYQLKEIIQSVSA